MTQNQDHDSNKRDIIDYISRHHVAVLGTVDAEKRPYGAAVYLYASDADLFYFITKNETQKFKNIQQNPAVSVTIADATDNSSLQAQGQAGVVTDASVIEMVMGNMATLYGQSVDWLPPLTKLNAGSYQVVSIKVSHARLAEFKGKHPGDTTIFKEETT